MDGNRSIYQVIIDKNKEKEEPTISLEEILKMRDDIKKYDCNTTWDEVQDMTIDEAINILQKHANYTGQDWTARPHMAKACQLAIKAMSRYSNEGIQPIIAIDEFYEKYWECPCCHREVGAYFSGATTKEDGFYYQYNFCADCGTQIDWSKVNFDDILK